MEDDIVTLTAACRAKLGGPDQWPAMTGYPGSLALCVIDAIQSTGPRYASVVNVLNRYRNYRSAQGADPEADTPADLIRTFAEVGGVEGWVRRIGNYNRTYSRTHAPYKGQAILQAATALHDLDIETIADLRAAMGNPERGAEVERQWRSVVSQSSGITWKYFLMLAGIDGVKTDRMIMRFVGTALGGPTRTLGEVEALVQAAAAGLGVAASTLDHAMWRYQSGLSDIEIDGGQPMTETATPEIAAPQAPSLLELATSLRTFANERNWESLHQPKNLLLALTGEIGELTALFAWTSPEDPRELTDPLRRFEIEDEIADVFIYLIRLADVLKVDLASAAARKIARNQDRFPRHSPVQNFGDKNIG